MSTLNIFLAQLTDADLNRQLVFATVDSEIGAGYHVTEFKLADVKSINCGARQANWSETTMQLLDGYGEDHMRVETFRSIATRSIGALPNLGDAPLRIEYAPNNIGLGLYQVGAIQRTETKLIVGLQPMAATCQPSTSGGAGPAKACCQPKVAACC